MSARTVGPRRSRTTSGRRSWSERVTDRWNAFITQVEPGEGGPGPLSGRTLAVKDLFDTAGIRTTYGSKIYADHVPERTAVAVERLLDCRRGARRQDASPRVRVERDRREPVVRHVSQPGATGQDHRWLVERQRGRPRRRALRARAGLRHGRLDPHPLGVLRNGRAEVAVGADPARRRLPALPDARRGRADGDDRGRHRAHVVGARRATDPGAAARRSHGRPAAEGTMGRRRIRSGADRRRRAVGRRSRTARRDRRRGGDARARGEHVAAVRARGRRVA